MIKKLLLMFMLMVTATATMSAQEKLEQTLAPVIVMEEPYEGYVQIQVMCDEPAVIHVFINDVEVGVAENYYLYPYPQTSEDQVIDISAYAIADGKAPSDVVYIQGLIPALTVQTAMPELSYESWGSYVMISFCNSWEDPDATIYYRFHWDDGEWYGDEFFVYDGEPIYVRNDYDYPRVLCVEVYAKADGKLESEVNEYYLYIQPEEVDTHKISVSDFSSNGIYYKILSNTTVGVTRQYKDNRHYNYWVGDVMCSYGNEYPCYSGNINIPATVNYGGKTYTVTAIIEEAFMKCDVTEVTIPNTVTEIGNYAFAQCNINQLTLPETLTTIDKGAFTGCSSLSSANIPAGVSSLGDYAFSHCEQLTDLSLNGAFTAIGKYAFSNCAINTQVTIPATVTAIGEYAFRGCEYMTDVSMPNGVESIGNHAFMGCSALTDLTMPASLTTIGNSAFAQCEGLTDVTLDNALTTIGNSAFSLCANLTSIDIPETVTKIGNSAFYGCKSLLTATLPGGLNAIDYSTFLGCTALNDINLPASLTSIGYDAFNGCKSLPGVALPAAVTSIAARAFDDCPSLASIQVKQGNTVYDSRENCNALIETGSNVLQLGCKTTVIPSTITVIGDHAFYNCADLTSVTIPEGVTRIGNYAFYNCKGLTEITIPATVDTICSDAFYTCTGLKTVTCLAELPPVVYYRTFISCYDATLRVERESIEDYKVAEYWNQFNRILSTTDPEPGDVNGDGIITIADVTTLIDMLLSGEELPAYADVNGDGIVSIADITDLIDMLLSM